MATDDQANNEIRGATEPEPSAPSSEKVRVSMDLTSKRGASNSKNRMYLVVALVGVLALSALFGFWVFMIGLMQSNVAPVDESKVKADPGLQVDKAEDDSMKDARAAALKQQQEQAEKERRDHESRNPSAKPGSPGQTTANSTNASQVDRSSSLAPQSNEYVPPTPAQRKMAGGVVMTPFVQGVAASGASVSGQGNPSRSSSNAGRPETDSRRQALLDQQAEAMGGGASLGGTGSATRGNLSDLSGTNFKPSMAMLAPKRKYLLAHGTYTRCVLYTEIVTDQPGIIDCRLTEPVYSADGSTELAAAGDRLTGEQSVEVKTGQVNVFTSWTEMDTQAGVRARLDSLGAGPMGASGTAAWIDNHYMQRFGGAVMLSFIQDALQAAANTTQKSSGSGGYTVNNSEQNVESMASKVLDNTINIPPTAHVSPGTVMTVIVARDIDFSSVFENH